MPSYLQPGLGLAFSKRAQHKLVDWSRQMGARGEEKGEKKYKYIMERN